MGYAREVSTGNETACDSSQRGDRLSHGMMGRVGILGTWLLITLFGSSAAVITRFAEVPAASIGFWRVFGAGIALAPWWWQAWERAGRPWPLSRGAVLSGVALGIHFATWCWAIQHTSVANAALFIGMQPLIVPLVSRWIIREGIGRWELVGSLCALAGTVWITGHQAALARNEIAGSLVALFSAGWCSVYFVLTRKYRGREHIMLFSVPVYFVAAVVQVIFSVVFAGGVYVGRGWTPVALLGLIALPTVGGHTLAMYLLRHASAQMLALSVPAQFVLAAFAGWLFLGEVPSSWFYPGAVLILAGVTVGIVLGNGNQGRNSTTVVVKSRP